VRILKEEQYIINQFFAFLPFLIPLILLLVEEHTLVVMFFSSTSSLADAVDFVIGFLLANAATAS
jgi:hypothetical protein